jgi:hypothetical protein
VDVLRQEPWVVVSGLSMNVRYRAVMLHVDVGQQVFRYERLEACAAVTGSQQRRASTADLRSGNSSAHCEQADCGHLLEAEVRPSLEVVLPDAARCVHKRRAAETGPGLDRSSKREGCKG